MEISITLIIIIVTGIVSFIGFKNSDIINKLIFYPPAITYRKEWYRFFTCGVIHKDIPHLLFNMYALFLFGQGQVKDGVEYLFQYIFGESGKVWYIIMYIMALGICLIPTYLKNKDNANYMSLGASGAVSAVVFAYILLNPLRGVGLVFIPVFIPGFLFGILYLLISYLLAKRGGSTINHSAHIWGALFGVVFVLVAGGLFSSYPVIQSFIYEVKQLRWNNLFQTN